MNITLIEGLPHANGPRAAEIFLPGAERGLALGGLFSVIHREWPSFMGVDEAQELSLGVAVLEAAERHRYPSVAMRDRGRATDVVASAIVESGFLADHTVIKRVSYEDFLRGARNPIEGIPAEVLYADLAMDGSTPLPSNAHWYDLQTGALIIPPAGSIAA